MRGHLWLLAVGWGLLQATDLVSPARSEGTGSEEEAVWPTTPALQCGIDQFKCEDGLRCIPQDWYCDHLPHCADASDELDCFTAHLEVACALGEFRCDTGACIPEKFRCNGRLDCGRRDYSDEESCPTANPYSQRKKCAPNTSYCATPVQGNYVCLFVEMFCDGRSHCFDGSDEWDVCDEAHNRTKCANLGCEMGCRPTFEGPTCYCENGYTPSGLRCVDEDECQWDMCDQLCTNTQGGYNCSCVDGFTQLDDPRGCRPTEEPVLVVGTPRDLRLYRAGRPVGVVPEPGVTAAYVDRDAGSFCYIRRNLTDASFVCRETARPERASVRPAPRMFPDLSSVGALAADWVSGNLYLADEKREAVYVCRADGVRCRLVVTGRLNRLRGLAVDAAAGVMFWTVWGTSESALERALLDGSRRKSLVALEVSQPGAVAVDPHVRRVYWLEGHYRGRLYRADYWGGHDEVVYNRQENEPVRGMSVVPPTLWLPLNLSVRPVWVSHARAPHPELPELKLEVRPAFTLVAHPQPEVPHHPCGTDNGGCDHLCITSYNESRPRARCMCSHGYRLAGHAECVRAELKEFMVVVLGAPAMIKSVPLAGDSLHWDWEPLVPVTDVGRPSALAYDAAERVLYWTDVARHEIARQRLDGTGRETLLTGIEEPAGLALDPLARNLYWTDAALGTVNVARLSRLTARRALLTETGPRPRSIVLDPPGARMFWAAWSSDGGDARLQTADTAGGSVRALPAEKLRRPVGLVLYANRLYWCDTALDRVAYVDLNTEMTINVARASKPTGAFVLSGLPFWAERDTGLLMRGDMSGPVKMRDVPPPVLALQLVREEEPAGRHGCARDYGGCAELCLPTPEGRTCACAADDATCRETEPAPVPVCPDGQFHCGRGRCIDSLYVCDGDPDCPDGSDENATAAGVCAHAECPDEHFQCDTTRCIVRSWVCDGLKDCRDGTDEGAEACGRTSCGAGQFVCATSRRCVPAAWRCDGAADCGAGDTSDELGCAGAAACPPSMFSCDDGGCAPWEYYCDGRADCRDASDERACASTTPAPARALDTAAPAVCEEHEFQCRNTECIRNDFRCDGRVDCLDGSDEQRCDTTATPPATQHETRHETTSESPGTTVADSCSWPALSCDNATRCVPPLQLCDGSADCRDGADEADRCGENMCAEWTCSHGCQPAPAGPVCSCPAGLHLQTDRRSCGPDHPCQEWGVCSQTCQPQKNRHKCTCLEGYRLADDGFTCKSTDDTAPLLVFSNRHELRALELRGGAGTGAGGTGGSRPLVSSLKNSIALDWHRAGPAAPHVLYWSDVLDDAIYRGELAGGVLARIEPVLRGGLVAAEGLAVDWVAANLYWVAGAPRQIEVATLDGRHRTTLLAGGMEQPRALALDARRGLLFWTDWEEREPRIERCTLSGRDRRVAVAIEPGGWPNGLALDFAPERLYWIDAHSDSVHTSLYDGGDRREVLRGHPALSHPFAIALFESHVYWTDWRANGVVRANKWNGSDAVVVQRTLSQPFDVKVVHASRRPRADTPCSVRAGGCSHLCLISEPGKRECACPHAMRLATDGETCTPREVALLVARAGELLGLDPEEPARPLLPAVAGRPLAPVALHFHAASRRIFWADSGLNEVRAVGLTSGPPVTLADAGVHSPRALALDWLAGLLFYSTRRADGDAVLVTDLAGERPAVLLDESAALGRVTGLAAHPRRGKLYWTRRADGRDVLEESGEDGSARRLIASGTGPAGGLALDATAGLLYWVNTDDGSVRSADPLSGRVRDVALPTGAHASAVAVHGGLLYWADEAAGSLRSCPPDNCTQPRTLRNDTDEVLALRVYDASEQAERGGACSLRRTPCTQLCLPVSETDSVCRCALGYTADGPRCEGAKEAVIFSTGSSVVGVAPDSGQEVLARLPRTAGASSLGLLVAEDAIFWADGERGGIWRVRRDGSERRAVLPPGLDDAPAGLALDGAGDALYWGDTRARLVEVSRTDGSHRAALLELPAAPSSLVLDEAGGWLFVAAGGCVSRARPDGSDHRLLHNGTVVLGLGAHPASRTLFLLESGPPAALRSLPYEGGESALLLSDSPLQHPVALAVSDDRLYWLDTQHERGALMTAPLSDVSAARPLLTELGDSLKDVTVWSTVRSSASAAHPCSVNNGGCSQLCLSDGSRAQCVCPHGRVTPQGRCEPHEQFVVFARVSRLEFLHATDDGPLNAPYGSIENKELMRNAIALTYEYNSSLLFYSDIQRGTINMVHFNGTDHSVLVDQQGAVEGLAFESTSRTLYWSSSGPPRLMRASLTELLGAAPGARAERVRTVLYLERGARPRGLDVDPCLSRVYWADWNSTRPAIQRAFSNGYQLETVIRTDILMPNGLALDRAARKLYWADARLDKIERAEYDGSRRRVLTSSLAAHPFDLSVLGGYVYWTDWVGRGVFRADKLTGDAVQLRADVPRPMGVAAAGPEPDSCPPDPCRLLNGGCAELCRTDAAGAVECACRESRTLSPDGHTCADPTSTARCPEDRFACTEGGQCVPLELTCDGVAHCGPVGNSSDEDLFYCTSRPCPRGWFSCGAGGRCAPPSAVCDGRADCDDAADERSCECGPQQARCASGRCVPASWRCDGVAQCADGSDELQCPRAGCAALGPTARPCSSGGGCYLPSWHCDKARDCDDGSDEWNCTFVDADSAASDTSVMETAVSGCGEMQFACGNGTGAPVLICIPASWRCDGRADCADESDETVHCRARARSYGNCSREEYRCDDGACVPRGVLCDGVSQCAAGEDERQCDCAPDTFRCRDSAECRDRALYCDGDADCEDGSDEPPGCSARVSSPPPPPDEVPCAAEPGSVSCAGRCVPRDLRCDGRDHCQDGGGRGAGTDEDPVDCSSYEHNVGGGTGATGESCAADRWRCAGGACVSRGALCDGHDDCGDFSDELHCHIDECKFENGGCSQHCADLPVGRACWCRAGFRLDGDGSTCHDVDECREDRPCDHACRNTVGSYACSCRAGYSLAQDGLTCAADGDVEAALIFTNRYYIRRAELRPGAPTALLVHNLTNGVALDMDWAGGCLYWSDVTRAGSSIRRACRDEPGRQQVLHAATLQNPDGLAVDWVAGNLYWCDKGTDTIEVSRLDGRHRRVLLRDGLQEPRALALDPLAGLLYWSDWGSRAHIGRAGMDGAGRRVLLARGLGWPNALTLHRPADELYFADAREDYVAVLELGSLRVRTLLSRARQPWLRLHHVFALAVWGDRLYWSDWEMRAVEGCRRIPPPASPADCHTVTALLHKPMDLRVFHPARQPPAPELSAACAALRCAGACLLAAGPGGARATCSCPEHFELSPDGRSCSPRCTSAHFECRSTLKCIPYWWRCDTQDDCGDGSDEARSCPRFYCAPGQFQCDTERCLHPAALCDGTAQCTDGADERDCEHFTCLASQWKCPSDPANNATARCIPAALRCDGRADCAGGHDEAGCPPRTCPPHHFTCDNGRCITPVWVCDADSDCGDGSDERDAMCAARTCSRAEFRCDSGRCIPRDWLCDDEPDCPGREDERSCDLAPCEPTYFRCPGTDRRCVPGRWRCDFEEDCADGADERDCKPRACSESEFRCGTGECVRGALVCSGTAECGDGSDEEGCGATCPPGARACKAGPHCVPQEWWCDGESDCGDGSDEEECEGDGALPDELCGGPGGFRCGPGAACMPPAWRCDGRADCVRASDERDCENLACPPDEFRCADGTCITDNLLCDGTKDCRAGDDEEARVCAGRPACLSGRLPCGDGRCVPDDLLCDEPGADECEFGTCSQLCLARKRRADGGARLCKCAPGYRMPAGRPGREGGHACEPLGREPRLLVGGSDGVRLWEMSKSSRDARGVWPAGTRVTGVTGALRGDAWWAWAVRGGAVYRANVTAALLGSGDAIVDGEPLLRLEDERALAVWAEGDWDRLYVSSAGPRGGALHVTALDGRRRVVLWRRAGSWPSSLALHAAERLVFWSDAGSRPAIMVCGTDGGSPRELVTRHLRRPAAVAVDGPARRLYFSDVRLHTLETVRLDGGDRRLLADFGRHDSPHSVQQLSRVPTGEVRGAAVVGEWLLVACRRGLLRVHKRTPPADTGDTAHTAANSTAPPLLGQYAEARGARLSAVTVLHEALSRTDEPDACAGRCGDSALCVPRAAEPGYSCLCPDGLLPDESEPAPDRRACVPSPRPAAGTSAPDSSACPLRCPPERSCALTAGAWRCACPALYSGPRCDVPRCPAGCACPEPAGPDESPPRCVCAADRDGPSCARSVSAGHEMPPCAARPCLHGGTCSTLQGRSYCVCPPGHSGRRCEVCQEPQLCRHNTTSTNNWNPTTTLQCGPTLSCEHGGRCVQLSESGAGAGRHSSVCVCEGGWGGALCDEYVGHDHACLTARCPPPAVCVWRGREPYCACPARAACTPRDLCRKHCAERACFLDGLGRPQCRCGPHCSFDPALEASPRGLPGATLTGGVLAALALLAGVLAALYVLRGRRRRSFGHRRLADNVEITNPMYQPHDDDDLPPQTSPSASRAGTTTTSHHFANPVYDTMYAGPDDVRAVTTEHEHAGLLSELSDSPGEKN